MGDPGSKADEVYRYNRAAWNAQVARGNRWTVPVNRDVIARARAGTPEIVLTPQRIVPRAWFPELRGCQTLMLASGGGQQSPVMAAAGAVVTVVDLSDEQLRQDRLVAEREGLDMRTIQASMDDLSVLPDSSFDLVVHPCSNSFVPDVRPVWRELARVTRPGAWLLAGFCNPLMHLFDESQARQGRLQVTHSLPYSDLEQLPAERLQELRDQQEPLWFGHTLTDQIGGQLAAGFVLHDMYEDHWGSAESELACLDAYSPSFMATRAQRT